MRANGSRRDWRVSVYSLADSLTLQVHAMPFHSFLELLSLPPLLPPLSPLLSLSESIARSSCVEGQESCGKKWHNKDFEFCYKIPTRCHAISHLPRKLLPGIRHVFQLHGNRYLPRNLKLWCSWVMQCSFFFLLLFIFFFSLFLLCASVIYAPFLILHPLFTHESSKIELWLQPFFFLSPPS